MLCKIGSILLNLAIWDQHASAVQLAFLALGLAGGAMFQQPPLRSTKQQGGADEKQPLLDTEAAAVKQQQPLRISISGAASKREARSLPGAGAAGQEQA
jgi:hypothetical protein